MLTAKEYFLWSHFMCDYYYDRDANESCKKCPLYEREKGCVAEDFSEDVDIDSLIVELEKFKTKYMEENYGNISYISFFKKKFPRVTPEIYNICPNIIYGKDCIKCPEDLVSCSNSKSCWSKCPPLTFMPPEVENIMKKY